MTAHRCTSSRRPTVSRSRPKKRHEAGRLLTGCTRRGGKHPICPGVGVNCMSKSCLVVDDSKVIRKVARHILESMAFAVEEAADGQEALTFCRANRPAVILPDWTMPVMSGMERSEERGVGEGWGRRCRIGWSADD